MRRLISLVSVLILVASTAAFAQVVTELHLGTVPPGVQCGEVWVESGVELYFTSTTADDCDGGGNCFFGLGSGLVWLFPARLMVDLGDPTLIYRVEIDVRDNCGVGCTKAFLYNGGSQVDSVQNTTVGAAEVLVMDLGAGENVDAIAISSCEGEVLGSTITIFSEVVAGDTGSWGAVKAIYR